MIELVLLTGLLAGAIQDYRTGEVYDMIWLATSLSVITGYVLANQFFALFSGIVQLLMCFPVFVLIEKQGWWGRADSFAIGLIILATPTGLYWKLPLIGLSTFTYAYFMQLKQKELRIVPGILLGYLLTLAATTF